MRALVSVSHKRKLRLAASAAAAALAASGLVTLGSPATPAVAQGSSNTVHNSYTQWWNTAWAQNCDGSGAAHAGRYESGIECSFQGDKVLQVRRAKGDTGWVSGDDCRFKADNGTIAYLG